MLLSNINYIIKDINYFSLYKVKYKSINNKLIFKYKRIKVFKLNCNMATLLPWQASIESRIT
jgi:hypothetical protein